MLWIFRLNLIGSTLNLSSGLIPCAQLVPSMNIPNLSAMTMNVCQPCLDVGVGSIGARRLPVVLGQIGLGQKSGSLPINIDVVR